MTRRRSLRVVQRDECLLPRIQELKAEHPCWGDRRSWAYLRCVEQLPVDKQWIGRLMRKHHLLVPPHVKLKAKRTPTGSKPRPTKPHERWGIDMTKVLVEGCGWVYIVVVLDWYTKAIVGYYPTFRTALVIFMNIGRHKAPCRAAQGGEANVDVRR